MKSDQNVRCFSSEEYLRRHELTREWMEKQGLTGLILYANRYGGAGVDWLSNFPPRHDTYLVWPLRGEATLLVQIFNHVPNAQRVSVIEDTRWGGADSAATVVEVLKAKGLTGGRVGLVGKVPYTDHQILVSHLPGIDFIPAGKGYTRLRLVKSAEEHEWLQEGAKFTDKAMEALIRAAAPGVSEFELVAAIEASYTAAGGEHGIHFLVSTPMANPSAFVPAQNQTGRILNVGDAVISELSAGVRGYAGQIHRPIAIGQKPTPLYQRVYDVAMEAYLRITAVLKPGATTGQVLDEADLIEKAGLSVCDDLVHGYGLGYLDPVLRTRATANSPQPEDFVFEENMILVVQPNVYDPESGAGLQLGNMLRISADGAVCMQDYPMGFFECGR